jgi:hypothetical protein
MNFGTIVLFGIFWNIGTKDDYEYSTSRCKRWDEVSLKLRLFNMKGLIFSATVFLSGTRLFVDPPEIPEPTKWSRSFVKSMFTLERVLGAFFSILFFLTIAETIPGR